MSRGGRFVLSTAPNSNWKAILNDDFALLDKKDERRQKAITDYAEASLLLLQRVIQDGQRSSAGRLTKTNVKTQFCMMTTNRPTT